MDRDTAIRQLWEAATSTWNLDEDSAEELRDSSVALPGRSIRGKELYRIGVALGMIEADQEGETD